MGLPPIIPCSLAGCACFSVVFRVRALSPPVQMALRSTQPRTRTRHPQLEKLMYQYERQQPHKAALESRQRSHTLGDGVCRRTHATTHSLWWLGRQLVSWKHVADSARSRGPARRWSLQAASRRTRSWRGRAACSAV